jgi:hypothetical protein
MIKNNLDIDDFGSVKGLVHVHASHDAAKSLTISMAALLVVAGEVEDEAQAIAVLHRSGWRPSEIVASIDEAMAMSRDFVSASSKIRAGASLADPDMAGLSGDARPAKGVMLHDEVQSSTLVKVSSLTSPALRRRGLLEAAPHG